MKTTSHKQAAAQAIFYHAVDPGKTAFYIGEMERHYAEAEKQQDVIRAAATAYLHGNDTQGWNGEDWDNWQDFLRRIADALGVDHEDVEALG